MNQEEEKERIFLELQAEIQAGLEAYERGECIPLEEEVDRCVADMEKGNYFTKEELMKRYGLE